jgi:hypothetical protein
MSAWNDGRERDLAVVITSRALLAVTRLRGVSVTPVLL